MKKRLPRGAIASSRSELAAATPHVISAAVPDRFIALPAAISDWGNHTYGDCVTAEEAFSKACTSSPDIISDATAINWAQANGFLNSAKILLVLQRMQASGFPGNGVRIGDGSYYAVNWEDVAVLKSAISQGVVKFGVSANQFEKVYGAHKGNGWIATNFVSDVNSDHCVSVFGYGEIEWLLAQMKVAEEPNGVDASLDWFAVFTWGSIGVIDYESLCSVTAEAWLRAPTTVKSAQNS
jgi:hypothetical protein